MVNFCLQVCCGSLQASDMQAVFRMLCFHLTKVLHGRKKKNGNESAFITFHFKKEWQGFSLCTLQNRTLITPNTDSNWPWLSNSCSAFSMGKESGLSSWVFLQAEVEHFGVTRPDGITIMTSSFYVTQCTTYPDVESQVFVSMLLSYVDRRVTVLKCENQTQHKTKISTATWLSRS